MGNELRVWAMCTSILTITLYHSSTHYSMKEQHVKKVFAQKYNSPFRFFAAPGRINLIGEHTDYNEGFVMPAAIDKRIYLAIAPRETTEVELFSIDFDETVAFDIHQTTDRLPHWAKYPYGVVKEILAAGHAVKGFKAVFGGDIPTGAGLSSSAALESAFATALNTVFNLSINKLTLASIGQLAEHNYAGVRCGIMDQFASIHGKENNVIQLDCRSLAFEHFPLELHEHELLLADTRVKHSLASSAYNQRREECEEGVRILSKLQPGIKNLRDVNPEDVRKHKSLMSKEVFMRCEYVAEENERVKATARALAKGEIDKVGQLLYASHQGLKNKYQVSCRELDLLVDTALKTQGVLGARMMGGGFGGCTLNIVETSSMEKVIKIMTESFQAELGSEPAFYRVNISGGATEM